MLFLLQKELEYTSDILILKNILDRGSSLVHEYIWVSLNEIGTLVNPVHANAIPIGTIEFTTKWLNCYTNVKIQNPIEVPSYLRTVEFLKRDYKIVSKGNIPEKGMYFIKDVSELKRFSYTGFIQYINTPDTEEWFKSVNNSNLILDDKHLYQVSEVVDILSEYRVYVIGGKIHSITNYDGDPLVFPDVSLIKKANSVYSLQDDYPKSYTLDVMVTDRGTSIIEAHTFLSTGLYHTLFGSELMYAYRDSLDYVLNYNTKQTTFT